ncbi:MAG TPA: DsrE/DsrF/DrsH-like family protein [Opitutaceae bacterium]|nr:DsrE/DsrF/DrsH-like family protein [Opitutaceae bacterium]
MDDVKPDSPANPAIERLVRERVDAILDERLAAKLAAIREAKTPSMTIIATKGTLDWAYPPFILASTASALGWNVSVFFTFYGLELLKKDLSGLQVSPLGNPAMPMKMPFGPDWFKSIRWNIPNAMQSIVPGFEAFATTMMKQTISNKGVAPVAELREACIEGGVNLIGCQMTVDLFGYSPGDFIPQVKEYCGAATFLPMARDADVSLFI